MMYDREHAPGEIKLRFHIRNKRGEDILGALRYDPATGQGFRRDQSGKPVEFFDAGGYVEIDGRTNPLQEEINAIYASVRAGLDPTLSIQIAKKVVEDAKRRDKELEAAS